MLTTFEIALARVEEEDRRVRENRIRKYQREINEAVDRINAKDGSSVELAYDTGRGGEEAGRVHHALQEMGYVCSEIESRQGEFIHGRGYDHYLAFTVTEHVQGCA